MDDMHVYFEDLIIQIDRCIQATVSFDAAEEQLSRLLYDSLDISEKRKLPGSCFPLFETNMQLYPFNRQSRSLIPCCKS